MRTSNWIERAIGPDVDERFPEPWVFPVDGRPMALWTNGTVAAWGDAPEGLTGGEPPAEAIVDLVDRTKVTVVAAVPKASFADALRDVAFSAQACGWCLGEGRRECWRCNGTKKQRGSCEHCNHECFVDCMGCTDGKIDCGSCNSTGVRDNDDKLRSCFVAGVPLDAVLVERIVAELDDVLVTIGTRAHDGGTAVYLHGKERSGLVMTLQPTFRWKGPVIVEPRSSP